MPKSQPSRQRTHSIANPVIYRGGDPGPAPKDHRSKTPGTGQQGSLDCPLCGAQVTLKKATEYDLYPDLKIGDLIITRHRVGGGRYSVKRGDVLCKQSGQMPPRNGELDEHG